MPWETGAPTFADTECDSGEVNTWKQREHHNMATVVAENAIFGHGCAHSSAASCFTQPAALCTRGQLKSVIDCCCDRRKHKHFICTSSGARG